MSLATRCPVCQTVFRVVQDQLKVSEGWVRCGRCAKVFNAFEGLFDLEREFPALQRTSASGSSTSPSQKVLEDLARRNPRPQHSAQWEQELDTRAAVRDATPPATLPSTRPSPVPAPQQTPAPTSLQPSAPAPMRPSAPTPVQPSASPAFKPSAPAPLKPSSPPAFKPSAPAPFRTSAPAPFRPSAPAPFRPSAPAPFRPSVPAPFSPSAPATSPVAARADAKAAPTFRPSTPGTSEDATIAPLGAPARPAAPTPAQAAVPPPAPKPVAAPDVGIRDEPAPMASADAESDREAEDTFEALFRSDGEMAEPATASSDVDIMLDGAGVEPASLDDAVDSRLLTFVQQADKAERWRRPWVRAAMAAGSLVLVLLLVGQLVVARRDAVVAQWPESRSLVQSLCGPFNCRIEPLRRIDQISVDSSGLTRIDDGPVYRLALVLRNRGDTPLLTPSIDLSLTDASGTLVSRRMLSAGELGASRTTIAPQQELPLQALLMSADRPLTGYTIEIFYP